MALLDPGRIASPWPHAPKEVSSLPSIDSLNKSIRHANPKKFLKKLEKLKAYETNHNITAQALLYQNRGFPLPGEQHIKYITYLNTIDSILDTLLKPIAPSETKSKYDSMLTSLLSYNPLGISTKLAFKKAILNKNIEKFTLLIDYSQDINEPLDHEGNTALHLVTMNLRNNPTILNKSPTAHKMINAIVLKGGKVNILNNICATPLYYAVCNNHPQIVQQLLNYNANPDIRDLYGRSSLSIARQIEQNFANDPNNPNKTAENQKIISYLQPTPNPKLNHVSVHTKIAPESAKPPTHNHNSPAAQKFSWINIFKFWNLFSLWGEKATPSDAPNASHNILEQNSEKVADHLPKSWFAMLCSWFPPSPFDHEQQVESTPSIEAIGGQPLANPDSHEVSPNTT